MNEKTLYLECTSGISGDMTVAALLDLGASKEKLVEVIDDLGLNVELKFSRVYKNGIGSYDFDVVILDEMGHHDDANHCHRTLKEINPIIDNSKLSDRAKELSHKMFNAVAHAESRVHGLPFEEVHFHEVGAVDSIVDILATAFCICDLGIEKVKASTLNEGRGQILCQHGVIPVPVPATMEIVKEYDLPLNILPVDGEMVTPTGAAIAATLVDSFGTMNAKKVYKIGYGAGKKDFEHANVLRAYLYEDADSKATESENTDVVNLIETNIDDSSPEELGFCLEKLFELGVNDAFFTPIYMKKARPAYTLIVMCNDECFDSAIEIIFKHTSSTGVRHSKIDRIFMNREKVLANTIYGDVEANKFTYKDISKVSLEYDSVKKLAEEKNVGITSIYKSYKVNNA